MGCGCPLMCLWGCCGRAMRCYHGCCTSPKLRRKFGLKTGICGTCCGCITTCCCISCKLEQQHKFIRTKLQNERWGQLGSLADSAPDASRCKEVSYSFSALFL